MSPLILPNKIRVIYGSVGNHYLILVYINEFN